MRLVTILYTLLQDARDIASDTRRFLGNRIARREHAQNIHVCTETCAAVHPHDLAVLHKTWYTREI